MTAHINESDVVDLISNEVDYAVECRGFALLDRVGKHTDLLITPNPDEPTLHFKFTNGEEFVVAVRRLS